mmetsp:Transcript_43385/g.69519  ORF Transcript_43385/g.69519 Transcript_43385/m.69519 type:complete len:354 (-) Transcript_43385:309-1370(-)
MQPSTTTLLALSWFTRILGGISLIGGVVLIFRNFRNQRVYEQQHESRHQHFSLFIWSTITFLWWLFAVIIFLAFTAPYLCSFVSLMVYIAVAYPHISLTLYQLARLRYVTSSHFRNSEEEQVTSTSIEYPKCVFIVLYCIGIPLFFFAFMVSAMIVQDIDFYAFDRDDDAFSFGCIAKDSPAKWRPFAVLNSIWYLVWDWTVVTLYAYKLVALKRKFQETGQTDSSRKAIRHIVNILSKLLFLTAISELYPLMYVLVFPCILQPKCLALRLWNQTGGVMLDNSVICVVIYLMNDHNHSDYLRVLRAVHKCGCLRCCCCCARDLEQTLLNDTNTDATEFSPDPDLRVCVETTPR